MTVQFVCMYTIIHNILDVQNFCATGHKHFRVKKSVPGMIHKMLLKIQYQTSKKTAQLNE